MPADVSTPLLTTKQSQAVFGMVEKRARTAVSA